MATPQRLTAWRAKNCGSAALLLGLGLGAGVFSARCSDGEVGIVVRRTASQRTDVDESLTSKDALRIPQDEAFNLKEFPRDETGDAQADSRMEGADGVTAKATAKDGGNAAANFALGYTFDNRTGKSLRALVTLHLKSTQAVETGHTGELPVETVVAKPAPPNAAKLEFVIKDTNGFELKRESILDHMGARGPEKTTSAHDLAFDVTFEPDRGYYLYILGHAEARSAEGRSASVSLDASECAIVLDWSAQ